MYTFKTALLVPFVLVAPVLSICPGFNFGIGNQQSLGNGISRWTVYDDSCNPADSLTTTENPCTQGIFTCSPPPITFTGYTSSQTGLKYTCRPDPNSGTCGNDAISVCCRNDGN
ncbi:hypothetical protein C8Q75DRAFT_804607 [Abortiporus biennis]|nr:hypothetical protein C8Q75DRAFT_804607 [Abortiporus biennis]